MIVTKARVWDVLCDPSTCAEAATAGQRLLDALDGVAESVCKVVADTAEIAPDVSGEAHRVAGQLLDASELIVPTVSRLRELGR